MSDQAEQQHLPPELVVDKYKNRRSMAWWSFRLIGLVGIPCAIFGLWSDGNAARLMTLSPFLTGLLGVWIGVVTLYFGSTTITDFKEISMKGPTSPTPPAKWQSPS